jgi:cytosine/adenosine deaminase-related metal-dependent hydrolase
MLLQRVAHGPAALTAREALELATLGGARVLGRDDIGRIAVGKAADLAIYDLDEIGFSGAMADPVAALVFCGPMTAAYTIVHGKVVVREGRLTTLDTRLLTARHNRLAAALLNG